MENDNDKIIEIFSGTVWECEMVKSLLENEGIECFFRNYLGTSYGYIPTSAESVRIMISDSNYEKAKIVVDSYIN
ncbi:MAG: hypothetical protein A2X18_03325 [Bacteroidetes bacterium GWF2_40_14]|nr:MAG: hypothetical protein A2X18_03325 [Bacteroidetes bacterium GWF2_40_14]